MAEVNSPREREEAVLGMGCEQQVKSEHNGKKKYVVLGEEGLSEKEICRDSNED